MWKFAPASKKGSFMHRGHAMPRLCVIVYHPPRYIYIPRLGMSASHKYSAVGVSLCCGIYRVDIFLDL
jgi:hypothetical protein